MKFGVAQLLMISGLTAFGGSSHPVTGVLYGTVTDPSGAAVPGATVRVIGGKVVATVYTDGKGQYAVVRLAPGEYRVRVSSYGFLPLTTGGLVVIPGHKTEVDAPLSIRPLVQEVTVTDLE